MSEEEIVVADNSNTAEEVTPEVTENTESTAEESVEEVRVRLAKAEELANNYKVRAEKAEKLAKKPVENKKESDLSSKDIIAINRANIHEDDIDEVVDYAKFKKIPIGEALKSGVISTLLKDREEQRKLAKATNTGPAKRSASKSSDEEIISKMESGQLPEDPTDLVRARWNLKKKK